MKGVRLRQLHPGTSPDPVLGRPGRAMFLWLCRWPLYILAAVFALYVAVGIVNFLSWLIGLVP